MVQTTSKSIRFCNPLSQNVIKSICAPITYQQMTNKMFERASSFLYIQSVSQFRIFSAISFIAVVHCIQTYIKVFMCNVWMHTQTHIHTHARAYIHATCLSFHTTDTILFFISIVYVVYESFGSMHSVFVFLFLSACSLAWQPAHLAHQTYIYITQTRICSGAQHTNPSTLTSFHIHFCALRCSTTLKRRSF